MFTLKRILTALVFALAFSGVTFFAASAQEATPPPDKDDCAACHTDFQLTWEIGAHGQATTDPVFVEEWNKQGNPSACLTCHVTGYDPVNATWEADGVTCKACHMDSGGKHPDTPMSVNKTTDLCGSCHTNTRFGWAEWEGSTHYQNGMDCTNCHDPHSASVKMALGKDASQLCIACHEEASMNFPYSKHNQEGVTCIDCHLEHMEATNSTNIHQVPDHSFKASVQTCNSCHTDQMHADGEAATTNEHAAAAAEPSHAPTPAVEMSSIVPEPTPVSPMGYAGLAVLIGLAAGMVLAPWLERWYRFVMKKDEEVKHD
ncbi:MAG: hypothetical protein HY864_06685 [Chloroflexi bacterium]|nr:hypothetical protein [Chloroflexota bacterium]